MGKRLYKSNTDKKIDGVCGGIGEYLNIDSTLVRLCWIIFVCMGGSGIIAYIICAILMPRNPGHESYSDYEPPRQN
jgi:phage shock protein C